MRRDRTTNASFQRLLSLTCGALTVLFLIGCGGGGDQADSSPQINSERPESLDEKLARLPSAVSRVFPDSPEAMARGLVLRTSDFGRHAQRARKHPPALPCGMKKNYWLRAAGRQNIPDIQIATAHIRVLTTVFRSGREARESYEKLLEVPLSHCFKSDIRSAIVEQAPLAGPTLIRESDSLEGSAQGRGFDVLTPIATPVGSLRVAGDFAVIRIDRYLFVGISTVVGTDVAFNLLPRLARAISRRSSALANRA